MHSSKDEAINIKKSTSGIPSTEKKNVKERLQYNENEQLIKVNQREMQSATANIISTKESTSSSSAAKKKKHATMHCNEHKETMNQKRNKKEN